MTSKRGGDKNIVLSVRQRIGQSTAYRCLI